MFAEYNRIFVKTLEKSAQPEIKLVSNTKKTTSDNLWVTTEIKQFVAEKHL